MGSGIDASLWDRLFKKQPAETGVVEYIIVGLGNPGPKYEGTRHNAGFIAVDYLAEKLGVKVTRLKFKSLCGDGELGGKRVLLLKPSTFMNLSGEAVRDAAQFYKIPMERVLVLFDDASLPVGAMRIRRKGSDGGQKGVRNIIYLSGCDEFPRIKIGIGQKPHPEMEMADWVLSRFTPQEKEALDALLPDVMAAAEAIVRGDLDAAMNKYNVRGQGNNPV